MGGVAQGHSPESEEHAGERVAGLMEIDQEQYETVGALAAGEAVRRVSGDEQGCVVDDVAGRGCSVACHTDAGSDDPVGDASQEDQEQGEATGGTRIAQEAVTNALPHAPDATQMTVEIDGGADQLRLTIHDDGQPVTQRHPAPGNGPVGMTEQAEQLGGTLRAGSSTAGGWIVEATLPNTTPRAYAAKRSS